MSVSLSETDFGTKKKTRKALSRIQAKKGKRFEELMNKFIRKVLFDAKQMCPVDTGALQGSIRKVQKNYIPKGHYVVEKEVVTNYRIIAGGPPYYNPKYKKFVDYASAIHNGVPSKGRPAIPFLSDALRKNEYLLRKISKEYLDWFEREWKKDQCPPRAIRGW